MSNNKILNNYKILLEEYKKIYNELYIKNICLKLKKDEKETFIILQTKIMMILTFINDLEK
jgi:hypothetical protein